MKPLLILLLGATLLSLETFRACADEVQMRNGDRYTGKVILLNADELLLQNEVLGTLKLPRAKVSGIVLGVGLEADLNRPRTATNTPGSTSNAIPEMVSSSRVPGAGSITTLPQTPTQILEGAGPEARAKFNEMLSGFLTGKLSVEDIRAEARSAAEQLRALQGDLGEEAGFALNRCQNLHRRPNESAVDPALPAMRVAAPVVTCGSVFD